MPPAPGYRPRASRSLNAGAQELPAAARRSSPTARCDGGMMIMMMNLAGMLRTAVVDGGPKEGDGGG